MNIALRGRLEAILLGSRADGLSWPDVTVKLNESLQAEADACTPPAESRTYDTATVYRWATVLYQLG